MLDVIASRLSCPRFPACRSVSGWRVVIREVPRSAGPTKSVRTPNNAVARR